jgi:hypothetical protein
LTGLEKSPFQEFPVKAKAKPPNLSFPLPVNEKYGFRVLDGLKKRWNGKNRRFSQGSQFNKQFY